MPKLDDKLKDVAEKVLKRKLSDEEELELYRISDAMGMSNIQSFLYLLLVFKLHEDTTRRQIENLSLLESEVSEKFKEMSAMPERINETLERSITRVLKEGTAKIGAEMGEHIAEDAKGVLSAFGEYHSIRGQITLACFICVISAVSYWMGAAGILESIAPGGRLEAILFLPVGWCVFLGGAAYTFLWVGDHWGAIKKSALYKILLGVQILCLVLLAAALL